MTGCRIHWRLFSLSPDIVIAAIPHRLESRFFLCVIHDAISLLLAGSTHVESVIGGVGRIGLPMLVRGS